MVDPVEELGTAQDPGDSSIPAVYTYFGQFVDHDITFEVQPADLPPSQSGAMPQLLAPNMSPLSPAAIRNALRNFRTGTLDLDSVYGLPAPRDPVNGRKLLIGQVFPLNEKEKPLLPVPGKGPDNDLPREPESSSILHDRAAMIGDPRNDENTIISQLHLALLKAHNALVDQGRTFDEARTVLRQHYQHIVLHDFLRRVCHEQIVDDVLRNGNRWYNPFAEPFFMPLEFAVAAYRFGHTMVRDDYDFNLNFNRSEEPGTLPASLRLLFTFSALSGQLGSFKTLPENWVIQWENFVDDDLRAAPNKARRFDTKLAGRPSSDPDDPTLATGLFRLHSLQGEMEKPPDAARLAVRNLLRGYRLRMPTGQAVADLLGVPVMTAEDIEAAAGSAVQAQVLRDAGFLERTPLWFYILAEAKHAGNGERLGPVASTIVAEVLIGLVRRSADSILRQPGWLPSLSGAHPGRFQLADLLRFAGVLAGGTSPRTYIVQARDTLSSVAQQQLGEAKRWPEIFALNRGTIRNPDLILPGQVLILPGATPIQPTPRFHVVRPGDALSSIAQQQLGDEGRWPEIFAVNRDVISNPDVIFPGQVLALPT